MSRASPYQGNFGGGEFSPLVYGRIDADRYKSGLSRLLNMICSTQGGAMSRGGTYFTNKAKNNAYTRIVPFKFSETDAVLLEFGNNYIRFYKNRGIVESSPGVPYEVATGYAQADLQGLRFTQSLDTLYIFSANYAPAKLFRVSALSWILSTLTFIDGPYGSGSIIPGINGPRLQAQASSGPFLSTTAITTVANVITAVTNNGGLFQVTVTDSIDYMANGDQVYITGVGGATGANGTWFITRIPNEKFKFLLQGSTFAGTYTTGGTAKDNSFIPNKIGAVNGSYDGGAFRFTLTGAASVWRYGNVNYVYVAGGVYQGFSLSTDIAPGSLTEILQYRVPAYGYFSAPNSVGGFVFYKSYPTCGTFHENRLFLGGAGGALQRIDGSNTGDYLNFAPSQFATGSTSDNTTITDSNAVSFSFLSERSNIVYWLKSDEKGMTVGTSGGPWIVRPSSLNQAITPTNIVAKKVIGFPSSSFDATVAGKAAIFVEASKRRVRELTYFYDIDGFRAIDLSELAEHLPSKGISTEAVFQNAPQNIVWTARNDGVLLGITYDRTVDSLKVGWHQHQLGGYSDASNTPPVVESLAVIPSPDGTYDDVWLSVKRYVNGVTFRSIEYISKIMESFNDQETGFFVDCGLTYDSPVSITSITRGATTVIPSTAHGLSTGDLVRFRNVAGLSASGESLINRKLWSITRIDANSFSIPLNSSSATAFTNDGNAVYRKMVRSISGLSHLEGQTVAVTGDGADLGNFTVSSGAITLVYPGAGTVHVGLPYSQELQQLRLDAGARDGTSFGKTRRVNEVQFMVDRSASFEYGVNFSNMIPVDMRQVSDPIDQATPLFSGIKDTLLVPSEYDTENQIAIRQNRPLPLTVLAIMPQIVTYDKG